ncbi:MAG: RluA family pseudouridine synthase [Paenisporosarcina sp.]|nr:RluA family pseudouridine synthase [Paenisporosarcina sp.]
MIHLLIAMPNQFQLPFISTKQQILREALAEWDISKRTLTAIKYEGGSLLVNGQEKTVRHILQKGDMVTVIFPPEKVSDGLLLQAGILDIVYEDEVLLIVNKPAGLVTIPSKEHPTGSLANIIAYYYDQQHISSTVHILTRLDRDTSGLICLVKNRHIHHVMTTNHLLEKTYEAFVEGNVELNHQSIIAPIGRKGSSIIEREVQDDGQFAHTDVTVIKRYDRFTHVSCQLQTGRTHQIRVHLAHINHPLVGDELYGGSTKGLARSALHCSNLTIKHPITKEIMQVKADLPTDLCDFLSASAD